MAARMILSYDIRVCAIEGSEDVLVVGDGS